MSSRPRPGTGFLNQGISSSRVAITGEQRKTEKQTHVRALRAEEASKHQGCLFTKGLGSLVTNTGLTVEGDKGRGQR